MAQNLAGDRPAAAVFLNLALLSLSRGIRRGCTLATVGQTAPTSRWHPVVVDEIGHGAAMFSATLPPPSA